MAAAIPKFGHAREWLPAATRPSIGKRVSLTPIGIGE